MAYLCLLFGNSFFMPFRDVLNDTRPISINSCQIVVKHSSPGCGSDQCFNGKQTLTFIEIGHFFMTKVNRVRIFFNRIFFLIVD